jgi:hypothetical protein
MLRAASADRADRERRTMMIPGFTAGAALDHYVDRYRGVADASSVQPNGSITPAGGISMGWGDACNPDCIAAPVTGGWCICFATW